ncbi:helix-turn-helix domain-containing protein [Aureispira sp. CCB-QB1]|uniref:helix-turn-helix domain-containing protein n=1 Tax=Aureispira sp. CCB-QB1 TaxID=1313421 RepID=UPI000698205C|nr:helix-turn-helix transcriptional regulator [Aureispira sp. CCB-QB1]
MTRKIEQHIKDKLLKVGARLRSVRKQKGYTNYDHFAYEHNMSRSQYGKYETGSDMHLSTLFKLLEAHNMTIQEFFSEGFEIPPKEEDS